MKNVVGRPVRGNDFFDREEDSRHILRLLQGHHVLLLAPRRVGKTSLMFRLVGMVRQEHHVVYETAATSPNEMFLIGRLYAAAAQEDERIAKALLAGRLKGILKSLSSIKAGGLELALRDLQPQDWRQLGDELVKAVRDTGSKWLLLVDELPVFLLEMLRSPDGIDRVRVFLNWFRDVRQGPAEGIDSVRWLLAGSIGLDAVTQRYELGATINDLRVYQLGAFIPGVADHFLEALAIDHDVALPKDVREHILSAVGWCIPYHLQLVFAEILDSELHGPVTVALVDDLLEALVRPGHSTYFDTWYQRLSEELGSPQAEWARLLLGTAAQDPQGATQDTLSQILASRIVDPEVRERELAWLLRVLENDGYLVQDGQRFRFRSPLLRSYWIRRTR